MIKVHCMSINLFMCQIFGTGHPDFRFNSCNKFFQSSLDICLEELVDLVVQVPALQQQLGHLMEQERSYKQERWIMEQLPFV